MEIKQEITLKKHDYESELLTELEKYAKSKTDTLEFRKVNIKGNYSYGKKIDAVWKKKDFTYIIEAKPELNYEAIGQIFVYEHLYQREHPKEKLKKGIVCKEPIDKDLLSFCTQKDIMIFALNKNGIHEINQMPSD